MKRLVLVIKTSEGFERPIVFSDRATLTDLQGGKSSPMVGVADIVRVELQDDAEEKR
jgi:hypothetical protein